jgi:parallel beta-helix repeat protein
MLIDSPNNRVAGNVVRSPKGFFPVLLVRSDGNTVVRNDLTAEFDGIAVAGSAFNTVSANRVRAQWSGILISPGSHENTIERNAVVGGTEGMFLQRTYDNEIRENLVTDAETGVLLAGGVARNRFRDNKIVRNRGTGVMLDGRYDIRDLGNDGNEFFRNEISDNLEDGLRISLTGERTELYTNTVLRSNVFERNRDDGLQLDGPSSFLFSNSANHNGDLGIEAVPGVTDGGGNKASGNGDPRQCVNLSCGSRGKPH